MNSVARPEPQDGLDVWPEQEELAQRAAVAVARAAALALDTLMAVGCRHCGLPVEAGAGGMICHAPLEEGERPHPYAVHLACQEQALDQLAATSHEDISRWRLTVAGAIVLASYRTTACIDAPTAEAAAAMEAAYRLAEQAE